MTVTVVDEPSQQTPPAPDTGGKRVRRRPAPSWSVVCGVLALGAVLVLGFACYAVAGSSLSEARFQNTSYKTFRNALGQAVAPVGPSAPGAPVAVLQIPALGSGPLVVVEGTASRQLANGPGHRRDTPLPGQGGVSVIFGRRALFGAPFAHLGELRRGDRIEATTGQGVASYVVTASGAGSHPPAATGANRLVLVTADSAWQPNSTISVSADLIGTPQPSNALRPSITAAEQALAGDGAEAAVALLLWCQALLVLCILATLAARFWKPGPAYLGFAPAILAVLWNVYENAAMSLPNIL